jgi:aspartate kinase
MGSPERIANVAARVAQARAAGNQIVVVVSAMAGETNRLVALAEAVSAAPAGREYDVLLASGEQVSIALLAMALGERNVPARSFLAHQLRIMTDATHAKARIESIDAQVLRMALSRGEICVVAGFQGMDARGDITTLGRGGSDTTAVALAAALGAHVCEIFTDVDGVYTADPNVVAGARKIGRISYEEMLEMASAGAKVLQTRSVEFAMKYAVPVHVRSSLNDSEGSWVVAEEDTMEQVVVRAVTCDRNEARITVKGVPDQPGIAAQVFEPLAAAEIVVDMIIQNASTEGAGRTDLTFTVPKADVAQARIVAESTLEKLGGTRVLTDAAIAKVSVVGVGMRTHSGVASRAFRVLSDNGVNIQMIATSEIKISVVIAEDLADTAVRALHDAFGL